jgi:hypothetical protein
MEIKLLMKYLVLFLFPILLCADWRHDRKIIGEDRLYRGHSMLPLLAPNDLYVVLNTPYERLEKGMIVKRKHYESIYVHKLGINVLGEWETYGINNKYIDPQRMKPHHYLGQVIVISK